MHIDADAEREALEPFTITIGGRTYTARPLSWPAYRVVSEAADRQREGTLKADEFEKVLRGALRAVFPVRWRYLVRPKEDPVYQILDLTPTVRQRVTRDFFVWAAPQPEAASESRTSGPNAPAPSSAAPTP